MNNSQDIKNINQKINILKDKYTKELNDINYYYWPIVAKLKKNKKKFGWYFTLACCLLVSVVVWLLFMEIVNEYWIGISLGLTAVIITITTIRMVKNLKELNRVNDVWEKALVNPQKIQDDINKLIDEAKKMMIESLNDDVINKIGTSYDDILEYYNHWVENN